MRSGRKPLAAQRVSSRTTGVSSDFALVAIEPSESAVNAATHGKVTGGWSVKMRVPGGWFGNRTIAIQRRWSAFTTLK